MSRACIIYRRRNGPCVAKRCTGKFSVASPYSARTLLSEATTALELAGYLHIHIVPVWRLLLMAWIRCVAPLHNLVEVARGLLSLH